MSDPATVEIAEMVLCGSINKGIANSIKQAGGRALGLSGKDDNLIIAKKLGKKVVDEETGEVKVKLNTFRHRTIVVLIEEGLTGHLPWLTIVCSEIRSTIHVCQAGKSLR